MSISGFALTCDRSPLRGNELAPASSFVWPIMAVMMTIVNFGIANFDQRLQSASIFNGSILIVFCTTILRALVKLQQFLFRLTQRHIIRQ